MSVPEPPFPEGAKRIGPRMHKGRNNWVDMMVDAELKFGGIVWLRAQGGFGDGARTGWHRREDWIADLPQVSLHVGRHYDEPENWKHREACSMEDAMREAIDIALRSARRKHEEVTNQLVGLDYSIARLEAA